MPTAAEIAQAADPYTGGYASTAYGAVSDPYGTAASVGGPGAQAAYQLGQMLGAQPAGTVVYTSGGEAPSGPEARAAAALFAAMGAAGLLRRARGAGVRFLYPREADWSREDIRAFVRGWFVATGTPRSYVPLMGYALAGYRVRDGHVSRVTLSSDPRDQPWAQIVIQRLYALHTLAEQDRASIASLGRAMALHLPATLGGAGARRIALSGAATAPRSARALGGGSRGGPMNLLPPPQPGPSTEERDRQLGRAATLVGIAAGLATLAGVLR